MSTTVTNPRVAARVPENIQRRGKAKAALLGMRYGEYLAQLIEQDTTAQTENNVNEDAQRRS